MKNLALVLFALVSSVPAFAAESFKFSLNDLYKDGPNISVEISQQDDGRYTFSQNRTIIDWANHKLSESSEYIENMSCLFSDQRILCELDKRYVDGPLQVVDGISYGNKLWAFTLTTTSSGFGSPVSTTAESLGRDLKRQK